MIFEPIPNRGKKFKIHIMKELSDEEAARIQGGINQCLTNIAFSATAGGLLGGVGALVGGVLAATGPSCLSWW
jgi:hypothetical protein